MFAKIIEVIEGGMPIKRLKIIGGKEIASTGIATALITVCAWISVPIGNVPFTLQTFAVAFLGAVLGWKRALAAVFVYILMGLMGIPVFSSFSAGASALFGPTGGYIFGFLFLALLPALFKLLPVKKHVCRAALFFVSGILGLVLCYAFGTVWFMNVYSCSVSYALALCVLPFIVPDLIKVFLAAVLAVRLERYAA